MITACDISTVRSFAYRCAKRFGAWGFEDDVISDVLYKLAKLELPDDASHRRAFIHRVCKCTSIDVARRLNDVVKNRKLQWQREYSSAERDKTNPNRRRNKMHHFDIEIVPSDLSADWIKSIACAPHDSKHCDIDLNIALSELSKTEPVWAKAVQLYHLDGLDLREVGTKLGLSDSRICQILPQALIKLRRIIEKGQAKAA